MTIQARCATDSLFRAKIESALGMGQLVANITTPTTVTPSMREFCRTLNPDITPLFVPVEPPLWSRRDCCSINVTKVVAEKGGEAIFGYKIWANEIYAEAVAHCIWKDTSGRMVDVTFNPDGEMSILFVPVPSMRQTTPEHGGEKPRHALDPDLREVVELEREIQKQIKYKWMPEEEVWDKQLTYEEWIAGKR